MSVIEKTFVNSSTHRRQVAYQAETLLRHVMVEPGWKYLDFGTGVGGAPVYLARRYPSLEFTGVDIDPEQIERGRGLGQGLNNVRFVVNSGERLPFDDHSFEIVATNKVTHHIPVWEAALEEMVRVLKPGGALIYADLVYPGLIAAVGEKLAGQIAGFPTRRGLQVFLDSNSFTPVHLSQLPVHYKGVFQKMG